MVKILAMIYRIHTSITKTILEAINFFVIYKPLFSLYITIEQLLYEYNTSLE